MHTPSAALAWELWRRHRTHVITIIGLVLAFALFYPKLCALEGFNLDAPDGLDAIVKMVPDARTGPSLLQAVQILYGVFLACGPAVVMVLTLMYVVWMFTFTEIDQKAKDPMKFPARIFSLPVSTPFLSWWLLLAGLASILTLYASWIFCVRQPHVEIFAVFRNCFGWMTLLVVAQAIVWALAAWPNIRVLVLSAALFGFLGAPARRDIFESPFVLPPLFLLGVVLARASLQKMRHGQWQGWTWKWPFGIMTASGELRGPKRFASMAQAQLWFEWRQRARSLSFFTAALVIVPVIILVLARLIGSRGPVSEDDMSAFTAYLFVVPVIIYFCVAISPTQPNLPFLMVRPLTNGEMSMAMLKSAALSTLLSYAAVLAALGALPLLGNFEAVQHSASTFPGGWAAIVIGLAFLTWRMVAVNLCFVLTGNQWLASAPVLMYFYAIAVAMIFSRLESNGIHWGLRLLCGLLACLVTAKFLLAFLAFRISLKRRLLAPSALVGYLAIWSLLVAALLTTAMILARPPKALFFPLVLCVLFLVPLARIGLCPIALARNRHT